MITKNQKVATHDLSALIQYAAGVEAIKPEAQEDDEFFRLVTEIFQAESNGGEADMKTLIELTLLVQRYVELPVYTLRQAAAWLGLSYEAVRDAVYADRIKAIKPGHDLLVLHAQVEGYKAQQRWPLRHWLSVVSP